MKGVSRALKELHRLDIRHGDIKPENLLIFIISTNGQEDKAMKSIVLADVGLARKHSEVTITRHGKGLTTMTIAGTQKYMPPDYFFEHNFDWYGLVDMTSGL